MESKERENKSSETKDIGYCINSAIEDGKYFTNCQDLIRNGGFQEKNSEGEYWQGEKRMKAGLKATGVDFGRMPGSKLVINEKEFDGTEISKSFNKIEDTSIKKDETIKVFANLNLQEEFQNHIISEFNQGGVCYSSIAFFQNLISLKGIQQKSIVQMNDGLNDLGRDEFIFKKTSGNKVSFTSNISFNGVEQIADVERSAYRPKDKPILKCKTSFEFVWDEKKQEMHIENINLDLEPGQSLKEYIEKNKKKDTNNNQKDNNKEGEFNEVFSSFLDFIDERLEQMQQLGYTDDMAQEEALANLLEATLKDPCEDTYKKLDNFLAENDGLSISIIELKTAAMESKMQKLQEKCSEMIQSTSLSAFGNDQISKKEIAAAFGDSKMIEGHCINQKNAVLRFFEIIFIFLGIKEPEPKSMQDLFGICGNAKNYIDLMIEKNLLEIDKSFENEYAFKIDNQLAIAEKCYDKDTLKNLLSANFLPEKFSDYKDVMHPIGAAVTNQNSSYIELVIESFLKCNQIEDKDKITSISSILKTAANMESASIFQLIKSNINSNQSFKKLIDQIPKSDIDEINKVIEKQSDTRSNGVQSKELWEDIKQELRHESQNIDDTAKLKKVAKSASVLTECLKNKEENNLDNKKRSYDSCNIQESYDDVHPDQTPKKSRNSTQLG